MSEQSIYLQEKANNISEAPAQPQSGSAKFEHWALLFSVVFFILGIDQFTKGYILRNFSLYEAREPIPALSKFFDITYTRNTGAAFGLFQDASLFFLGVAVVASVVIIYYYTRISGDAWLIRFAMALQMGGAIGNAVDRIAHGFVVDFLHVHYGNMIDWPVFNLADMAIVVGVLMLIALLWYEDIQESARQSQSLEATDSEISETL